MKKKIIFLFLAVIFTACEKKTENVLSVELLTNNKVTEVQMVLVCQDQSLYFFTNPVVGKNFLELPDTAISALSGSYLSIILFGVQNGQKTLIKDYFYDLGPNEKVIKINL